MADPPEPPEPAASGPGPAVALSCHDVPGGKQYDLFVMPRGGSPIPHPLNAEPADGTPEDEERAKAAAAAILASRYGVERDLSGVDIEAC